MAFVAGRSMSAVKIDTVDLKAFVSNVSFSQNADTVDVSAFNDANRDYIKGLQGATFTLSGFFTPTAATGSDAVLKTAVDKSSVAFELSFGTTAPIITYSGTCIVTSYDGPEASVDGAMSFSASFLVTGAVTRTVS